LKKYIEVYEYYKSLIIKGQYQSGDKMPSIRKACEVLSVSKTTVQNAYFELQADGYIISQPQSGYYVTYSAPRKTQSAEPEKVEDKIKYDLKSGDADSESFDLKLWQRYIKSALRQKERMLSYGCAEGEEDLRQVLSHYIRDKRNVETSPDRIIVGAGVQALLSILCVLTKDRKTVSFPTESFVQGISLFESSGYKVRTRYKDADIIYVSPSHMTSYGDVMPIKRRLELVKHSKEIGSLIIEDDFDSDFLYQSKPTPSLYALAGGENVIYMGSFSNVLIPGIRISYMVLTQELAIKFDKMKDCFAQTASKTEQIALCGYIRDGHIASQTRKIRRHYTAKAKQMFGEIKSQIPSAKVRLSENGLAIKLEAEYSGDGSEFEKNGVSVYIYNIDKGVVEMALIPSAVESADIEKAVAVIKATLGAG